jgi:hypothetical protein
MSRALAYVAILLLLSQGTAFGVPSGDFTAGLRVPIAIAPSDFAKAYDPGLGFELGYIGPLDSDHWLTLSYELDLIPFDGEKALRDAGLQGQFDPPSRSVHEQRALVGLLQTFGDRSFKPYLRAETGVAWLEVPDVIVVSNGYSIDMERGASIAVVGGAGAIWRPSASGPEVMLGADYATAFGKVTDADALSFRIGLRYTQVQSPVNPRGPTTSPWSTPRWFAGVGAGSPLGSGTLSSDYRPGYGVGGGWEIPWSRRLSGTVRLDYDILRFDEDGFRAAHGFGPGSSVDGDNASANSVLLALRGYVVPTGPTPYLEAGFGRTATKVHYSADEPNHFEFNSSTQSAMTLFAAGGFRQARDRPGGYAEVSVAWSAPDDDMRDHALISRVRVGVIR